MMIVKQLWMQALQVPSLLSASVLVLIGVCASYVVQALVLAVEVAALIRGEVSKLLIYGAALIAIVLLRLGLSLWQTHLATQLGARVKTTIRRRALQVALVPARVHDTATRDGSLSATLGEGIDGTEAYVSHYIPAIAQVLIVCPAITIALVVLNPWVGLTIGTAIVLALVGPLGWKRMLARRGLDHWDSYENLSAEVLESLRGMATLRTLGDVPGTRTRINTRSEALRRATERVMRASLAETAVVDFSIQAGIVAAAILALRDSVTGQSHTTETYLILLLASESFRPIRELSRHWHAGFLGLTCVPGLAALGAFTRCTESRLLGNDLPLHPCNTFDHLPQVLSVKRLSFGYPTSGPLEPPGDGRLPQHKLLQDFSFDARLGQVTVLIGESGAGKSTIFDLILGLLEPGSGQITLDDAPLRPHDVAVVSQRPIMFTGTVRENLMVTEYSSTVHTASHRDGRGTRETKHPLRSDADLLAACNSVGLNDEIAALPHGLDSQIAEGGLSLSGGQRQRLALARALLSSRPVLLLDEPTSALDAERSETVNDTLRLVAHNRIVIMISHRREAIQSIDQVIHVNAK